MNPKSDDKFTFDFSKLQKGHTISVELIEKWCGHKKEYNAYSLAVLKLRNQIESYFRRKSKPLMTKSHRGAVVILEDAASINVSDIRCSNHLSGFQKAFREMREIDRSNLNDHEKAKHARNIEKYGNYQNAIDRVTDSLPPDSRPKWYHSNGY